MSCSAKRLMAAMLLLAVLGNLVASSPLQDQESSISVGGRGATLPLTRQRRSASRAYLDMFEAANEQEAQEQAKHDKERALLKMLIEAALASTSAEQQATPIERLISEVARSLEASAPSSFQQADQLAVVGASPFLDKREYIKPCSVNAVSCVRNPFRKHAGG